MIDEIFDVFAKHAHRLPGGWLDLHGPVRRDKGVC
jgi:hypothetical protein